MDVIIGQCVVSDGSLASAVLKGLDTRHYPTVKSKSVCFHSNYMFSPTALRCSQSLYVSIATVCFLPTARRCSQSLYVSIATVCFLILSYGEVKVYVSIATVCFLILSYGAVKVCMFPKQLYVFSYFPTVQSKSVCFHSNCMFSHTLLRCSQSLYVSIATVCFLILSYGEVKVCMFP